MHFRFAQDYIRLLDINLAFLIWQMAKQRVKALAACLSDCFELVKHRTTASTLPGGGGGGQNTYYKSNICQKGISPDHKGSSHQNHVDIFQVMRHNLNIPLVPNFSPVSFYRRQFSPPSLQYF